MTPPIAKPETAPPAWDTIPAGLAERKQWLLWKYEWPEPEEGKAPPKKWQKVPYYVGGGRRTGDQGGERDLRRLATLDQVRRAYGSGKWDGVGFGFVAGDGMIAIDIDNALDTETGEWSPRCLEIVKACDSVTEISPSGTGVHIFVLGETETAKYNATATDIGVEMFCGRQYFTVTGRPWPGSPQELRPIGEPVLRRLHKTIADGKEARRAAKRKPPAPAAAPARPPPPSRESPEQLRARVQAALDFLTSDQSYDDWISIGWALRDAFGEDGFPMWDAWSAKGGTYPGEADLRSHWKSFTPSNKPADDVVGVIFARARDAGWKPVRLARTRKPPAPENGAPPGGGAGGGGGAPPPQDIPPEEPDGPVSVEEVILRGKGNKPEDCRENVLYCLRHDPELQGLVAHNLFTELQDKTRRPPWGGDPGEWTEEDDLMLGEYLAKTHRVLIKGVGTIRAGVQMAARENKYHPVIASLRKVKWDGTSRLETWLSDCLGAVDRPYVRLVSRFFIMGMVARLLRPGCKFDYMLILQGDQGLGKSTAFRVLAEPFFMDTPFRIGDKDAYLSLQGVWLVEFSELEAMSKAESTAIKAFVTSVEDRFRPPYGSRMVKMPRRAVLAGTTNSDQFLKDATGDRRFWPVHVAEIRVDLLRACRDQLFAEALHLLEHEQDPEKRRYFPTRAEEQQLFQPEQDRWRMVDIWTDWIQDYVSKETTPADEMDEVTPPARRGFFTAQELFSKALQIKAERMDNAKLMQVRVSNAMRELGFSSAREPTGARKRGYMRAGWEFAPAAEGGGPRKVRTAETAPQASTSGAAGEGASDLPI